MIIINASGRLSKDSKVFNYGEGKSGVSFTLVSSNGQDETPEFLDCVIFNRGENLAQYLKQGDQIIVTGRQSTNKEGYRSCIVSDFEFGAKKKEKY